MYAYRGSILWGHKECTKEHYYGDRMYVHRINLRGQVACIYKRPILWELDAFQRTNPMRMECIYSVCTKDQSYGNMMHVKAKDQCKMHVQRRDPIWEHNACAKGPIVCGHV